MIDLADVIHQGPSVTWAKAKVLSVETDGTLTVSMNNGAVPHVKILESYAAPAVGDLANLLIFEPVGMLAIGKSKPITLPTPPVPGTPMDVAKTGVGTWDSVMEMWKPTFQLQRMMLSSAILYNPASFNPMKDQAVAAFQIQMQSTVPGGGSVPIFVLHGNESVTDNSVPFEQLTGEHAPGVTVSDTSAVWIDLPTSWGETLAAGGAVGVGLYAWMYPVPPATFTAASGSLRFTLLT